MPQLSPEAVLECARGRGICAATGASWSSTATRTGSIRSASRTPHRWWQNSTGPGAGTMRPSAKSTPLPAELAAQEIPGGRSACARRLRRCTSTAAFAMRYFRGGAGAGRSSAPRRSGQWVGRFLGRIHAVGRSAPFRHRARLDVEELGFKSRDFVLDGDWLPDYLAPKYEDGHRCAARGGRAQHPQLARRGSRSDPRRLPSRQHPLDRSRPALRRSRRLRDRAGDSGPVDAARRECRGNAGAAHRHARGL